MDSDAELSFAYKYPFSDEAKRIVERLAVSSIDTIVLESATKRVEEDIAGRIEFVETSYSTLMLAYIMSYAYSRMLASTLAPFYIKKFVEGEAERAMQHLIRDDDKNMSALASELGISLNIDSSTGDYSLPFWQYLKNMPTGDEFALVHQQLGNGIVHLSKYSMVKVFGELAKKRISEGLPISRSELPKIIFDFSKKIALPKAEVSSVAMRGKRYSWIEQLLETPIPDARHRIVNLVLAPYLITVKGMSEEDAFKTIHDYIEKCKALNPNTKINDSYIRYQCAYSKKRGLRPLALAKAKELLGSMISFE